MRGGPQRASVGAWPLRALALVRCWPSLAHVNAVTVDRCFKEAAVSRSARTGVPPAASDRQRVNRPGSHPRWVSERYGLHTPHHACPLSEQSAKSHTAALDGVGLCQVAVHLTYAGPHGHAPIDRALYLGADCAPRGSMLAAAVLAITRARTTTAPTTSSALVPASGRELLRLLRITALPQPRRDRDHLLTALWDISGTRNVGCSFAYLTVVLVVTQGEVFFQYFLGRLGRVYIGDRCPF